MAELKTPFADILPPLSKEERQALEADIATNGIQVPIAIDDKGNILDGHHRYEIDPGAPTHIIRGLSPDEKMAYVYRSNMNRRNLSPAQKKRLREKMKNVALMLNQAGRTQQEIGTLLGVARRTVGVWLGATNGNVTNSCPVDSRVVIPKAADPVILERLDAGETQKQVAADFGVTRQAIGKRATKARNKREKRRAATVAEPAEEVADTFEVARGDIWLLGNHRIMCGDAYNKADVAAVVGPDIVTALITDPPYGINYQPDWKKADGSPSEFEPITGDTIAFEPSPFLSYPVTVLFGANYYSDRLPIGGWICWDKRVKVEADEMFGPPFELAWYRTPHTTRRAIMIRVMHGGVINADSPPGTSQPRLVPTQKPIALMEGVLKDVTKKDDLIFDPFIGSGTTLLACQNKGMRCLAMDIEPQCIAITLERWKQKTGAMPIRAERG
jgi:DNA modification methylase/DNA-binding XRE family transcriptional regulator